MKNEKAAIKLENILIGTAFMSLIFVLFFGVYGEVLFTYNVSGDSTSFGKIGNNLKQTYELTDDMKTKIGSGPISDTNAVDEMVRGGYTGIRTNPFTAVTFVSNVTQTVAIETGYINPEIVKWTIYSLITITAILIIYLIMRFRTY